MGMFLTIRKNDVDKYIMWEGAKMFWPNSAINCKLTGTLENMFVPTSA